MRKLFRHVRLLPAVMTLAAALLVIKGEGLVEARAQDGKSAPAGVAHSTASDPASEGTEQGSASTVDVLTSLSHRRAELDAREQGLTTRENLIAAAAKRVDQRIAELKALQARLQSLLGMRDAAEQKQFDQLVKSYSSMRPKDAARILNTLDDAVLVPVAAAMKADVLGAILAQMQPEAAQKLTVKLANRLSPQKIETQAAQLAAATAPPQTTQPATTPAATAPTPTQTDSAQRSSEAAQSTSSPQKSADNSVPTAAPQSAAPAQADPAKPAAKHRHRAKKVALAQAAFIEPAPVQSTPAQTPIAQPSGKIAPQPQQILATQQATANTTQRPEVTASTAAAGPLTKPVPQPQQPPPRHTVQTTTSAPAIQAMSPVPAPTAPSTPAGK